MANVGLTEPIIRQQASSAIQLVVQMTRLHDGARKVTGIAEVVGLDAEGVTLEEIFRFERTGVDESRRVLGRVRVTGYRPRFLERLHAAGIQLPDEVFREPVDGR